MINKDRNLKLRENNWNKRLLVYNKLKEVKKLFKIYSKKFKKNKLHLKE